MPGDYFKLKISSSTYTVYIAGIDTEYLKGDTALSTHHITCICNFGSSKMNNTDTTSGGYAGATVMQTFLSGKATELSTICSSHLLSRRVLLSNTTTEDTGISCNWEWLDKQLTLMSEQQAYGSTQWANTPYDTGEAFEKLPIFNNLTPTQIFGNTHIWLRGVYNTNGFCFIDDNGNPNVRGASNTRAAVAVFCLG